MGYTHGVKWTPEKIKNQILEVVNGMELKRMPSRKECEQYFHNCALANAITKRGGWRHWADELGLPVKESETYFGKTQEAVIAEFLTASGFEVRRMPQNFPYDLLVDDCVKIDVKAAHLYQGKTGNFYTFNLEKPFMTCDVYVLCALDFNNEIVKTYVVPSKFVFSNTQISIGVTKSKYDRFVDNWDCIVHLSKYWSQVS